MAGDGGGWGGMVGERFKREGTCVYLQLIHIVWQKPTQHCKNCNRKNQAGLKKKKYKSYSIQRGNTVDNS